MLDGEIFAFIGKRGNGKSLIALQMALRMADDLDMKLRFNFTINGVAFRRYCKACGYTNLLRRFYEGGVQVRGMSGGLDLWMEDPDFIYVLDEAGIWCDSRRWNSLPPQFLADLALMRHSGKVLFWISQNYDHVDKRLRDQTDMVISCESYTGRDKQTGEKKLKLKFYLGFIREAYEQIQTKRLTWSVSKTYIKKLFGAKFRFCSFPDKYDLLLFAVYDSFDRDLTTGDPVMTNPPVVLKVRKYRRISLTEAEFDERYKQRFSDAKDFVQNPSQRESDGGSLRRRGPLAGGAQLRVVGR
ncbi:zonular occludens toxin domain-containing protein [Coleofasciculus sp. E1-EBD-02]|uniref:zonular occludens toxin domain-containing protein n=1 Tax=Coleofasciculus sp. E1-EBD-02 TaxID=3068481 RepID=UPI0033046BC7